MEYDHTQKCDCFCCKGANVLMEAHDKVMVGYSADTMSIREDIDRNSVAVTGRPWNGLTSGEKWKVCRTMIANSNVLIAKFFLNNFCEQLSADETILGEIIDYFKVHKDGTTPVVWVVIGDKSNTAKLSPYQINTSDNEFTKGDPRWN